MGVGQTILLRKCLRLISETQHPRKARCSSECSSVRQWGRGRRILRSSRDSQPPLNSGAQQRNPVSNKVGGEDKYIHKFWHACTDIYTYTSMHRPISQTSTHAHTCKHIHTQIHMHAHVWTHSHTKFFKMSHRGMMYFLNILYLKIFLTCIKNEV